jgi:hypothetical protein
MSAQNPPQVGSPVAEPKEVPDSQGNLTSERYSLRGRTRR